jgi:RNA polymerase sigma-70 factor (ECF subfamily)
MEPMSCTAPAGTTIPDSETAAWLADLRSHGPRHDDALRRLHKLLVQAARREAGRRVTAPVAGVELADVVQQAADDALVAILAKLDQFRGESRFTTWAYKFAVIELASKLARHAWRSSPAALDIEDWTALPDRFGFTPHEATEHRDLLDAVRVAVETALTPYQRRVFVAIVLNSVPLDALAAEFDTNRNALYKALFDARRKVRTYLVANGYMETQ